MNGWLLRRGEESQDLAHQPLALVRIKQILRMRGAFQHDQLFRIGSFIVLRANPGKT